MQVACLQGRNIHSLSSSHMLQWFQMQVACLQARNIHSLSSSHMLQWFQMQVACLQARNIHSFIEFFTNASVVSDSSGMQVTGCMIPLCHAII
jgi:hypothetical protein